VRRRHAPAAAGALFLAAAAAFAHDGWLGTSSLRPKAGEEVTVRLLVGESLVGEARPRNALRTEKFVLLGPEGTETPVAGKHGDEPAGRVTPPRDGTYVLAFRSARRAITLPGEKFEAYLREEGLERVVEERARRGESGREGVEVYSRCEKAILCVGAGGDARDPGDGSPEGHDRAAGFPLELFPGTHPDRIAPGDEVPFRLVHGGKPLEGALVVARAAAARTEPVAGRTDREGRVRLRLGHAGLWMVKATHMVRSDREETLADWESLWASLVLDVPAPRPATPLAPREGPAAPR
jgi:uncharacterized GH25 family protein